MLRKEWGVRSRIVRDGSATTASTEGKGEYVRVLSFRRGGGRIGVCVHWNRSKRFICHAVCSLCDTGRGQSLVEA